MATGKVPDLFKEAIVHPVYKGHGKDPRDPGSYRPVAILPSLSKVLEVAVRDALHAWFKKTGFRDYSGWRQHFFNTCIS